VILLPLGGFAFGVGWLVGLILLWSSRLWTTRDKLIGTLIIPGGLAASLVALLTLGLLAGTSYSCGGGPTVIDPSTGAVIKHGGVHCTSTGGTSTASTVL
jgi:hypothetical protein